VCFLLSFLVLNYSFLFTVKQKGSLLNKKYFSLALFALSAIVFDVSAGKKGRVKGTPIPLSELGFRVTSPASHGASSVSPASVASNEGSLGRKTPVSPSTAAFFDVRAAELAAVFEAAQGHKGGRASASAAWEDEENSDKRGAVGRKAQATKGKRQ